MEISLNDPDKNISSDAAKSLVAVGQANKSLETEIQTTLANLPDHVYIHIRDESQRDLARRVSQLLQESGLLCRIERVNDSQIVQRYDTSSRQTVGCGKEDRRRCQ
ncbi:MAG: hypothetical protein IPP36_11295 [Nitrosomonadales bacterium]|nr:hypothetical protein [Nitrosomonadales bacterium]